MEIQTHVDIDAPPERVWAVLTDFEHQAWNPFFREIRGEVREGARLLVRLRPPGGKTNTFKPVVTRAEPGRALSWLGTLGAGWVFRGEHSLRLEPLGAGRTRLHHGETFGGVLVPLLRRSLDTDTRRGFEAMNEALKVEAERGGPSA